jgi:UDP-glucuronate 4-epimerase
MDVAVLRLFTVYGPRQRPDLAIRKFATLIQAGKPIPVFGDGGMARDYTYVTDTVDGIIASTQKEFGFEIFNLGESQTVRLDRLIELLKAAATCRSRSPTLRRRAPGWAIIRRSKSRRASNYL